jgi:riboflavin kinase / FMN adenylyltransferase
MADEARIVTGLGAIEPAPSVVSIGFFDGVHVGHQAIIRRAVDVAARRSLRSVIVTFDRHPMEVIRPGSQPSLLMGPARRAATLARQGVDLVVVVPFDDALRHETPAEFVDTVLAGPLSAAHVVVGENFRFGHKAAGDVAALTDLGRDRGFTAEGVPLLARDGVVVSSTEIRGAIEAGGVERAAGMLGRPHIVDGVVVRGERRGAELGFPTANLEVDPRVALPAAGIYAGAFHLPDGTVQPAATSVGWNPTFGGSKLRVEAHLLAWDGDLYGVHGALDFRHRLRDEERFDGPDALVAQMRADVEETVRLLGVDPR